MYNKAQFLNSLSLCYLWFDIEIRTQAGNERMCTCPEVFFYLSLNLLLKISESLMVFKKYLFLS